MMRTLAVLALIILILSTLIGCEPLTAQPTVTPEPCSADFVAEPTTGNCQVQGEVISCTGTTTIQFTDKSTGNVTNWAWDFNGNETIDSTIQNPTHTYTTNGNFTVSLTITTPDCEDKITKPGYINITGCHT